MERVEFAALWSLLTQAYPTSNLLSAEGTAAIYYKQLADLDADAALAGASRCIDDLDFPPTIAQLRMAATTERDSRAVKRAILPAIAGAQPTTGMPWYVRLQLARQKDNKPAGYPLLEDQDAIRVECADREIEIDVWPAVPRWYGKNLPIPADGEADHGPDCTGMLISEFEVHGGDPKAVYAPCGTCRPGQRAVFEAGLWRGVWQHNERAVRVYVRAELEAGNVPHPPTVEEQTIGVLWKRVLKDRGREPEGSWA